MKYERLFIESTVFDSNDFFRTSTSETNEFICDTYTPGTYCGVISNKHNKKLCDDFDGSKCGWISPGFHCHAF